MSTPLSPHQWRFVLGRVKCPACGWEMMVLGPAAQLEVRMAPDQQSAQPTTRYGWTFIHNPKRCGKRIEVRLRITDTFPPRAEVDTLVS